MAALLSESKETLPIHRRILFFTWLGWIFDFYDLYLLSLLLSSTSLASDLSMSSSEQAWLLGSSLGASALGGLGAGWLADRYGRKPILMLTIVIYSVGTCLSGLAVDGTTLLLARAFTGLGVGGEWAVAHAMVGETVPPHVRGRYGAYHDLEAWRRFVSAAGFEELRHYYRPAGLPRERQPWLASVWRRIGA